MSVQATGDPCCRSQATPHALPNFFREPQINGAGVRGVERLFARPILPSVSAIRAAAFGLDAGFDEHFAKPVDPAELFALVQRLLVGVKN